jgi:hypothetical protein
MWTHEHTGETPASPAAVWNVLRDLDNWASWDTSMQWVRLPQLGPAITEDFPEAMSALLAVAELSVADLSNPASA